MILYGVLVILVIAFLFLFAEARQGLREMSDEDAMMAYREKMIKRGRQ